MRKLRTAFVAGAAVIAAAGVVGAAAAASNFRVLTVRLPDGALEQIRYLGDQPPEVSVGQAPLPLVSPAFGLIGPDPVFADLDRISADMDRSAAAMLDEARRMEAHAFAESRPAAQRRFRQCAARRARLFRGFDPVGRSCLHPQRPVFLVVGRQDAARRDSNFGRLRTRSWPLRFFAASAIRGAYPKPASDRGQRPARRNEKSRSATKSVADGKRL